MRAALVLTAALAASSVIQAQPASKAGAAPNAQESVPQTGQKADQLRENLRKIKLPPGFRIELYAVAPNARQLAVGNKSGIVFVGRAREEGVWAVAAGTQGRMASIVKALAPSLVLHNPNGVCMSKDGVLYVIEDNRVLAFPNAESSYGRSDASFQQVYQTLVPRAEISASHGARVCRVGPDDKLYIALGQPYNVPPVSKQELYRQWGMGGIIRMDRDGKNRETYVEGIRNSVGIDFNPRTGQLWFTDNQVDGMGDDQPPEELNRVTKQGQNFGFPWYGGGHVRTVEYKDQTPPEDVTFPEVELPAHAAALGLIFYHGKMFPEQYRTAAFFAQHGSWNRTKPIGARVSVVFFKEDGTVDRVEPFAQGWLDDETGEYSGRPVDVAELADGSLLVSDDYAGAIYRISYSGK